MEPTFNYEDYLCHHGIKGQKWGVRRWQYTDGALTPAGYIHYGYGKKKGTVAKATRAALTAKEKLKTEIASRTGQHGNSSVDTYLKKGTNFYRVQSSDKFENFAFYATHKKHDTEEYAGLFGKNLKARANAVAKAAEKEAEKTGDFENAKALRQTADGMNIYQLKIANTSRLRVPSEQSASHIVGTLLKDKEFHSDLKVSIEDSKEKMRRPQQQQLFWQAEAVLKKDPSRVTDQDKTVLYRALNLSLTNHNEQEVRMQDKFYGELKRNGYSALLDLNDKKYSSYHAHSPIIVFDTSKVQLQSIMKMDDAKINKLYNKYNAERIRKEVVEQTLGTVARCGSVPVSKLAGYAERTMNDYLTNKKYA